MKKSNLIVGFVIVLLILCVATGCLTPYESHLKNGAIAMSNGNYEEAIAEYTKLIEVAPNDATGYFWRGTCYYDIGQYDLAIDDFTKAISLEDKSLNHDYNYRGLSYYAKKDYYSAIADFTKAIEIYPNPLYYDNRGLARSGLKNYDLAIQDFTVAIDLAPGDPRPYSNRADVYIATEQDSLAIADLRKVIEFSFDDPALMQSATERLNNLGVTE